MNKAQLEDYTNKELRDEIEKREKEEKVQTMPRPLSFHWARDFIPLRKICKEYITFLASDDYHEDNDWNHYIYEVALETVYGKSIWEWTRERMM